MQPSSPMVQCEAISFALVCEPPKVILRELSFCLEKGEFLLVKGPSGAGKTTLMSILAGVLRPTSGQVLVRGEPVSRFTAANRDLFRRSVGMIPQRLHLFDELTVCENLLVPLICAPEQRAKAEAILPWLESLELEEKAHQCVKSLSGGERQRVAILRALVKNPPLIVADEPTAHQDDARCLKVLSLFKKALEKDTTIIVAAHDPRIEQHLRPTQLLEL